MSVVSEAKSTRERYIRVAAITSIVTAGTWSICIDLSVKNVLVSPQFWIYLIEWTWKTVFSPYH
jgi:hypothetical protein